MAIISNDLIINETDIVIQDGDFLIGESDNQNVFANLKARKGQFYENPLIGIGIDDFQNSSKTKREITKEIREGLLKDNYRAKNLDVSVDQGEVFINILPEKIR